MVEIGEQPVVQALGLDRLAHPRPNRVDLLDGRIDARGRRRFEPQASEQPLPRRGVRPGNEPAVDLGEDEVRTGRHLRAAAHRGAEAGGRCKGTLDRDHEQIRATRGVVRIDRRPAGEHPVMDAKRGEVARTGADDRRWLGSRGSRP